MPDDEQDESINTILLRAPVQVAEPEPVAARFVCLDTALLESVPEGKAFPLSAAEVTIGRGDECTLRIDSEEISRLHARTSVYSDRWVIEDADSRNGVTVNGERITGKTVVMNGDTVCFGKVPFRFDVGDAASAADDDDIALEVPDAEPATAAPPAPEPEAELILELPEDPAPAAATPSPEPSPGPPAPLSPAPPSSDPEPSAFDLPEALGGDPPAQAAAPPRQAGAPDPPPAPPAPGVVEEMPTSPSPAPAEPALAHARPSSDPAGVPAADVAAVREQIPQLVGLLLAQARAGDAGAARACIEFLVHEEQRLPDDVAGSAPIGQTVKNLLCAMTAGEIPPRQALDALQAIAAARDLLKKA